MLVAGAAMAATLPLRAQTDLQLHGDVGAALFRSQAITSTADKRTVVVPYIYADYGPWYGRFDTFGYRMLPMGYGYLEVAARVTLEGYRPSNPAIDRRSTPLPIGVGSFQETPFGGFFLYAFADPVSGGTFLDATYALELGEERVHFYPQLGVERRSSKYVQHLYGVSAGEASRGGAPMYSPGSAVTPKAAVAIEYRVSDSVKLTGEVEKRWLGKSIYDSPLVISRTQTVGFFAVTQTFQ
jgi:outer membrane protein